MLVAPAVGVIGGERGEPLAIRNVAICHSEPARAGFGQGGGWLRRGDCHERRDRGLDRTPPRAGGPGLVWGSPQESEQEVSSRTRSIGPVPASRRHILLPLSTFASLAVLGAPSRSFLARRPRHAEAAPRHAELGDQSGSDDWLYAGDVQQRTEVLTNARFDVGAELVFR